jgi:hypothetical protein
MDFTTEIRERPLSSETRRYYQLQKQDQQQTPSDSSSQWKIFRYKPFWIDDPIKHEQAFDIAAGNCCFNHIVGLPTKKWKKYPLFDYEHNLIKVLQTHKRILILKARGLGLTEFMLRYMAWLCLYDNKYKGADMPIIVGPNLKLAYKLIGRMKRIFDNRIYVDFNSAVTSLNLNGVNIEAFPSNNPDAFRGLEKPAFFLIDEADFFTHETHYEARSAVEGASTKSNPWIVFVSTPNKPGGFIESFINEPESKYYKLKLDYNAGLGKIYTTEEIAQAKEDKTTFEREYNLKFLGQVGTCFSESRIEQCLNGTRYDPDSINPFALRSIGIDPGWGSSPFGITVSEYSDNKVRVLYAEEYPRPDYNDMLEKVYWLYRQVNPDKVCVDGSAADFVQSLKLKIGERGDYLKEKQEYKAQGLDWEKSTKVLPLYFGRQNKQMLTHTKTLIDNQLVAIHSKFDKLITFLRTASEEQGVIDKDKTSYHDIGDSFMLSLWYFQVQ